MRHYFERCSYVSDFNQNNEFNYLYAYMNSGLVPDFEKDLYVRPGYGALVLCCGNCDTLEKVILFSEYNNYYDFREKINEGYNFVVGPGVGAFGTFIGSSYAVYCSNYLEILEKLNGRKISK